MYLADRELVVLRMVENQIRLWLELDAEVLASVEDFFTLPMSFQRQVMGSNERMRERGPAAVDVADLVVRSSWFARRGTMCAQSKYIFVLSAPEEINGRKTFVPLGEVEISAICRLHCIQLQTGY